MACLARNLLVGVSWGERLTRQPFLFLSSALMNKPVLYFKQGFCIELPQHSNLMNLHFMTEVIRMKHFKITKR